MVNLKSLFSKLSINKKNGEFNNRPVGMFLTPKKEPMLFNAINLDTNNKCNQRCRFCFTSFCWDGVNMDLKTFENMLNVLPFVRDYHGGGYGFYLSCVFEPTVNPNFLDYLKVLPRQGKDKCFFTTNFSKSMDEDYIEAMLSSNVHIINISIHTLKPERFEYITQNKQFLNFKNNLNLLEKLINKKSGDEIPKLKFITMLLNENKDEVIDLIKYCNNHFPNSSHEIRTPYISVYDNMEWNKGQLLSKKEAKDITDEIKSLNFDVDIVIKSVEDLEVIDDDKEVIDFEDTADIYEIAKKRFEIVENPEYLFLRINPEGTITNKDDSVELIPENDSATFFKEKLFELYLNKAKVAYCDSYDDEVILGENSLILADKLIENDAFIELTGWCCPDRKVSDKLIIRLIGNKKDTHYFYTSTCQRLDADEYNNVDNGWCVGYTTYIEKKKLKDSYYFVDFIFKDNYGKSVCYMWDSAIKLN